MLSADLKSISEWFRDTLEGRREYTLEGALCVAQMIDEAADRAAKLESLAVVNMFQIDDAARVGGSVVLFPVRTGKSERLFNGGGDAA